MIIIIQRLDPQPFYSHEPVGLCMHPSLGFGSWNDSGGEQCNVVGYLNFHHITTQQIQRTIVTMDTRREE